MTREGLQLSPDNLGLRQPVLGTSNFSCASDSIKNF
jgi:hypothetical protein